MASRSWGEPNKRIYNLEFKRSITVAVSDNCRLIKVDFPVALGPNRKKDFLVKRSLIFRSLSSSIKHPHNAIVNYPDNPQ
jgi:hypothetical protein